MDRQRSLDRRYRRILSGGLAASAALHVALLALTFDAPLLQTDRTMEVERIEDRPFEAVPVVTLNAALPTSLAGTLAEALPAGSVANAAAASPALPAAASPTASSPPLPAPVEPEVTFEELTVFDPLSQAPIRPVRFTDLPEAVAQLPVDSRMDGEAEDEVAVYVPGSIGAAKRRWGGGTGTAELGGGQGGIGIFVGGGGGHCPMPGGRTTPPIWR